MIEFYPQGTAKQLTGAKKMFQETIRLEAPTSTSVGYPSMGTSTSLWANRASSTSAHYSLLAYLMLLDANTSVSSSSNSNRAADVCVIRGPNLAVLQIKGSFKQSHRLESTFGLEQALQYEYDLSPITIEPEGWAQGLLALQLTIKSNPYYDIEPDEFVEGAAARHRMRKAAHAARQQEYIDIDIPAVDGVKW